MKLAKPEDFSRINEICNHPEVFPFIGGTPGEVFRIEERPGEWFVLLFDGGCFICDVYSDWTVECHTCFLPGWRGRKALRAAKEAMWFVFCSTPCEEVVTKMDRRLGHVSNFAGQAGFSRLGEDERFNFFHLPVLSWLATVDTDEFLRRAMALDADRAVNIHDRWARLRFSKPASQVQLQEVS